MGRLQPLATLARNPTLRRVGLGFALYSAAEYGEWIAVLVYAYAHGGASASGLVAFAQLLPCVFLAPLLATFADRHHPGRALIIGFGAVAAGLGALAVALAVGAPPLVIYAVAVLTSPTYTITRPAMGVLLPLAVHTPDELTAANAATGWIESAGVVIGPLAASLGVAISGPGLVVAVFASLMVVAVVAVAPLIASLPPAEPTETHSAITETITGLRGLTREPGTAVLVGLLTSEAVFFGAMDVLFVVLAINVLGLGSSGVGVLNAAFGAGGLAAVLVTMGLVGRRRLAPSLIGAATLTAAVALISVWPHVAVALLVLAVANIGRSLFEVTGRTLLQRTGSPAVLGRIFGVLEGVKMLGLALGALVVPVLIHLGGTTVAIVGVGAIMPLVTFVLLPAVLRTDARADVPIVEIGLLRSMSLFHPLPPPELERIARLLVPQFAAEGHVVIHEGDIGDRFYLIADGDVAVTTAAGYTGHLTRGDGFGEIALLNDTPRTATVTTSTDTRLYTLERDDFLTAVTGMPHIHHAARRQVAERLAEQS